MIEQSNRVPVSIAQFRPVSPHCPLRLVHEFHLIALQRLVPRVHVLDFEINCDARRRAFRHLPLAEQDRHPPIVFERDEAVFRNLEFDLETDVPDVPVPRSGRVADGQLHVVELGVFFLRAFHERILMNWRLAAQPADFSPSKLRDDRFSLPSHHQSTSTRRSSGSCPSSFSSARQMPTKIFAFKLVSTKSPPPKSS